MSSFDAVDSWFEKGFRVRKQSGAKTASAARRDQTRSKSGASPARRGSVNFSGAAKTKNIKSVIRKAPEVMVKITGHSKGMDTVRHHLEYISRNGEVELVNESGEAIKGLAELKALREQLKASQIPDASSKREFIHVMFSMPAGTSERAVREAVANFCQEEFSNRRYVMAQHDDKDHSHVHVCVSTRDMDRADEARLSPRKNDLYRWRQGFADKLREQGVEAAASERRHRFQHQKSEKFAVRQIRADNPKSPVFDARRAKEKSDNRAFKTAMLPEKAFVGPHRPARLPKVYDGRQADLKAAVASGVRPANPAHDRIEKNRLDALARWGTVAESLENEGDRKLAGQVRELMQAGQAVATSRNQEAFDAAVARSGKVVGLDDGLER